ncbi:MAG: hypothetical protein ABJL54_13640 [Halioglobus sp.]
MKIPTYQFVAQMAAAFAVVVSLGLVAYELKLSRDLGMAEMMLTRINSDNDLTVALMGIDPFNRALKKLNVTREELTWEEQSAYDEAMNARILTWYSDFNLWNMGLLSQEEWDLIERVIKETIADPRYSKYVDPTLDDYGNVSYLEKLRELWDEVEAEKASSAE